MITARQVKSRFQKRHIVKIITESLKERTVTGDKRYSLKEGVTPEILAKRIVGVNCSERVIKIQSYDQKVHDYTPVFKVSEDENDRQISLMKKCKVSIYEDSPYYKNQMQVQGRKLEEQCISAIDLSILNVFVGQFIEDAEA